MAEGLNSLIMSGFHNKTIIIWTVLCLGLTQASGQVDMAKPFRDCGIEGSITIYDYQAKKWISSNIEDSQFPTLPASTFKIINTLIALESGLIGNENDIIKWPGRTDTVKYGYRPDIYRDMSIKEAFKSSAVWAYVELAKKIGKEEYIKYLTACNYGNVDLSIDAYDFWNFGNLSISPSNQIELMTGIFEESLPFSKESFRILKNIMIEELSSRYVLRAKTGWTKASGIDIGWWVGYVEKEDNVYFFATRLIKSRDISNPDFGRCRKEITKTILRQLKIIE